MWPYLCVYAYRHRHCHIHSRVGMYSNRIFEYPPVRCIYAFTRRFNRTHSHVTSIGRNARKQSRQCMPLMTTYLACRYTCMPSQTQMRRHIDMHANWNARTLTRMWVFVFGQDSCICIHTCSHHTCSHTCMSTCMHARTTVNPMALHGK